MHEVAAAAAEQRVQRFLEMPLMDTAGIGGFFCRAPLGRAASAANAATFGSMLLKVLKSNFNKVNFHAELQQRTTCHHVYYLEYELIMYFFCDNFFSVNFLCTNKLFFFINFYYLSHDASDTPTNSPRGRYMVI